MMYLNVIIITVTLWSAAALPHKMSIPSTQYFCVTPFLSKILNKFYDYPAILHYDQYSNYTFKKIPTKGLIYIFNYDKSVPEKRPVGRHFIHLIDALKIFNDSEFLRISTKISRIDMVMFIERDIEIPKRLIDQFFFAKLVFVVKIKICKTYYCAYKNYQKKCVLTEIRSNDTIPCFLSLKDISRFFKEERVGFTLQPPHIYRRPKGRRLRGIEIRLLKILSKTFNFTYKLVSFENASSPERNTVEDLLLNVKNGNVSWGMGAIIQSSERIKNFDFSKYVFVDGFYAGYGKSFRKKNFGNFVRNNLQFHLSLTLSGACVCATIYCCCKILNITFKRSYVMLIFLPPYEQTYPHKSIKTLTLRILFIVWWLMCFVLTISYKTYLIQSLLAPVSPLNDLEELYNAGFKFQSQPDDFYFILFECKRAPSEICKKILPRLTFVKNICHTIQKMSTENIAILGEMYYLKYTIYKKCRLLTREQQEEVIFTNNRLFGLQFHFWPIEKNSIFSDVFANFFSIVEEAGLFTMWIKIEAGIIYSIENEKPITFQPQPYQNIVFAFGILFVGYICSLLCFIAEKIMKRSKKGKKNEQITNFIN